jgi:electron transfer flavoprotein beta subunit
MKIAVCFKTLADYARLSEADWAWDERHFVDTGFVRRIFNCYDESALEMALKLFPPTEKDPDRPELTALTVDGPESDLFLRHLIATGYDHGVRIECGKTIDLRFNPWAVSCLIANYIRQNGQQLVLLGIQGGDGDNCQTGLLVAERLGWPCIREVTRVARTKALDCLEVTSRIDGATLIQTVRLPLVLTVGQSLDAPYLRFPSLKQKLNAKKKQVTLVSNTELGVDNASLINRDTTLAGLVRPRPKQSCVFLEGQNTRDVVQHLYDNYLKDRLIP